MKNSGNLQKQPNLDSILNNIIRTLRNLTNYADYLDELKTAYHQQDQDALNQIFGKLDVKLTKVRKARSITTARDQNTWGDPEAHFQAVQREKVSDLEVEFSDNLGLFQLASLFQYQPVMAKKFSKMVQNRRDIRQMANDYPKSNKNNYYPKEAYDLAIARKKRFDLTMEFYDLIKLYDIAEAAEYTEGIKLVSKRLQKIAPLINPLNDIASAKLEKSSISFVKK